MNKIVRIFTIIALVFVMAASFGCVTKTDLETLQIERNQDQNRIKQLEDELQETKQLLSQQIQSSQDPVRQKTADIWAELQGMRKDLATIRGEIDTMELRMDRQVGSADSELTLHGLKSEVSELEFILENQLQVDMDQARKENATMDSMPALAGGAAAATAAADAPKDTPEAPSTVTDPAKALYDKAYTLYKQGDYEKARSYWAEFTDTFTGHPYVPSAVFWQGQCYYKLKDYARAAILFEDVIERFKSSSKYKTALLNAGRSWDFLGKPELAKMRMEEIVKKFPDSIEATQAKRYLGKTK